MEGTETDVTELENMGGIVRREPDLPEGPEVPEVPEVLEVLGHPESLDPPGYPGYPGHLGLPALVFTESHRAP